MRLSSVAEDPLLPARIISRILGAQSIWAVHVFAGPRLEKGRRVFRSHHLASILLRWGPLAQAEVSGFSIFFGKSHGNWNREVVQ